MNIMQVSDKYGMGELVADNEPDRWPLHREENMQGYSSFSHRIEGEKSIPPFVEQFTLISAQRHVRGRFVGSQKVSTKLHAIDRLAINKSLSSHKNSYNPLTSALADVRGIEDIYS